ncbi:hypothetical protein [Variovorax sp. RCC_210]|uniref:hypothetical protein n=1 Tax=Variovorax sp. RCC_210 TaxID=3239217 RepID=UPI0035233B3E
MEHIQRTSKKELKINKFKICLLEKRQQYDETYARGQIHIDGFCESFLSPLAFWKKIDYYENWIDQLSRLDVTGRAFLPTTMYPVEVTNFIFGWSIYIEGEAAYLQNNMIIANDIVGNYDIHALEKVLRPRAIITEDGLKISEWKTTRTAISDFLLRLRKKISCHPSRGRKT